ncbi:MAG: hypothetical protein ACK4UP_06080 [Spirosomataceae bacterium]
MKNIPRLVFIVGLLLAIQLHGQGQYRTVYKSAVVSEISGTSSGGFSVGYENAFLRFKQSFVAARASFGYILGTPSASIPGSVMLPISVTYNQTANQLRKRLMNRLTNQCLSMPPKFGAETFLEFGGGYTLVATSGSTNRTTFWGLAGIRQQFIFDNPDKARILFVRGYAAPQYSDGKFDFITIRLKSTAGNGIRAGVSVGISL